MTVWLSETMKSMLWVLWAGKLLHNRVRDIDGFCDNFFPLTNQTKAKQSKPNKTAVQTDPIEKILKN